MSNLSQLGWIAACLLGLLWPTLATGLAPSAAGADAEPGTAGVARTSGYVQVANLPRVGPPDALRRVPDAPRRVEEPARREVPLRTLHWRGPSGDPGPPPKVRSLFQAQERTVPIAPPDTTGAIGKAHILTVTNLALTVHDRQGQQLQEVDINDFWYPTVGSKAYCGDPRVIYDPASDRWFFVAMAINYADGATGLVLANSVTADPTGAWHQVELAVPATNSIDQPLLGVTDSRVVVQANNFIGPLSSPTSSTVSSRIYSIDKADLLAGNSPKVTTWIKTGVGLSTAPTIGWDKGEADAYLVTSMDKWNLRLLRISGALGQEVLETVATWQLDTVGSLVVNNSNIGKQKGTKVGIDVGDGRIHDAILRNGSVWFAFSIVVKATGQPQHAAVIWQQVGTDGKLLQSGLIDDGGSLSHPSLAVDAKGNVLIGFSRMGADFYASAGYAYHRAGSPAGLTQPPRTLVAGRGAYDHQVEPWGNRWGDYSATGIDPVSDNLWTAQEFAAQPNWADGVWGVAWAEVSAETGGCASDADCVALLHCEQGLCVADVIPGEACAGADACATGPCIGGVCCGEPCAGACRLCVGADSDDVGSVPGTCLALPSKTPCDDGNPCTAVSVCSGSKCVPSGPPCDDGNPCTADTCDMAVGCSHPSLSISCSDGDACTVGDQCADGQCKPGAVDPCVPDFTSCQTQAACDPVTGCAFGVAEDGASCGDGTCRDGVCIPRPKPASTFGCAAQAGPPSVAGWLLAWVLGVACVWLRRTAQGRTRR